MIRDATTDDLEAILALAQVTREEYARYKPQFFRVAENAFEAHRPWITALIASEDVDALVAFDGDELAGYVIATSMPAPPVYDPGGRTGMIDDFAVVAANLWATVGVDLLRAVKERLRERDAVQVVVVSGHHDEAKRSALRSEGLVIAAEWHVASLRPLP